MRSSAEQLQTLAKELEVLTRRVGDGLPLDATPMEVNGKTGTANFVTEYDRRTQRLLFEGCSALVPDAVFIGEESYDTGDRLPDAADFARSFIIDPIDGTANFIRCQRHSALSVAYLEDGQVCIGLIYDPWQKECFTAVRGCGTHVNGKPVRIPCQPMESCLLCYGSSPYYPELRQRSLTVLQSLMPCIGDFRRSGSAALDLAYLAAGRADLFLELRLSPWDYAAGCLLVEEAGGIITDTEGRPLRFDGVHGVVGGAPHLYPVLMEHLQKTL